MAAKTKTSAIDEPPPRAAAAPRAEDSPRDEVSPPAAAAPRPKPRRRFRKLLVLLVVGGAAVWFAPPILAATGMIPAIIQRLLPAFPGRIEIGSTSLGWLSPIRVRNVVIHDADDADMLTVAEAASEKPLLNMLLDFPRFGAFRIDQPQLMLVLREDGSNVEDALAKLLPPQKSPASTTAVTYTLGIEQGTLKLIDAASCQERCFTDLALTLEQGAADGALAVTLAANGGGAANAASSSTEAGDTAQGGRLEVSFHTQPVAANENGDRLHGGPPPREAPILAQSSPQAAARHRFAADSEVTGGHDANAKRQTSELVIKAHDLVLDAFDPLLNRLCPGTHVHASVDCELHLETTAGTQQPAISIGGSLTARQLAIKTRQMPGNEELRLKTLTVGGTVAARDGRIKAENVKIASDVATLRGSGVLGTGMFSAALSPGQFVTALGDDDFECEGVLDAAKLVALLPRTLKIRDGVRVSSGRVECALHSKRQSDRRIWTGHLNTQDLQATVNGQPVAWDQPIEITFDAHTAASGAAIDKLQCVSEFITFRLSGDHEQGKFRARCEMARLGQELKRFVDLGDAEFAGRLDAIFQWKIPADGPIQANGQAVAKQFVLVLPGQRPWREELLDIRAAATGEVAKDGKQLIDSVIVQVRSGGDLLDLRLLEPAVLNRPGAAWPLQLNVDGDIASWLARSQVWISSGGWQAGGTLKVDTQVTVAGDEIRCNKFQVDLGQFQAVSPDFQVTEPVVRLEGVGTWSGLNRRLALGSVTLSSSALSLRAKDVLYQPQEKGLPSVSGTVAFGADLGQLAEWRRPDRGASQSHPSGVVEGRVTIVQSNGVTQFTGRITADRLGFAAPAVVTGDGAGGRGAVPPRAPATTADADRVTLTARAQYDLNTDLITVEALSLESPECKFTANGSVRECSSQCVAALTGDIDCELGKIVDRFRGYFGADLRLEGRNARQFTLQGPLGALVYSGRNRAAGQTPFPEDLAASAGLGWTSANLYGLTVGSGVLDLKLARGVVNVAPLDLAVESGRLTFAPTILLNADPAIMQVEQGPLLKDLQLSQEVCAGWMKYAAPLLAQATQASGRFSIDLNAGNVPLKNPAGADIGGVLDIQSAQLKPGPLGAQILSVAVQAQRLLQRQAFDSNSAASDSLLEMPAQKVEFRVVDRRVHHRGLELRLRGMTLRTSGSVGFDDSLDIIAEIPIPDAWVQSDPLLKGMQGKTLQIPLRGTLNAPVPDGSALGRLAQQLAGSAAESAIGGELDKQLNRLLPFGK